MLTAIIILSIVGLLLIFAEVLVPGGVLGAIGAVCLIGAIVLSYLEYGFSVGSIMLVGISLVSVVAVIMGLQIFPKTPMGKKLQLNKAINSPEDHPDFAALLNKSGEAITSLRPSGAALIDGSRIDVVSQGGLIDAGSAIKVVHTEGARVVVRQVSDDVG